MSGWSITLALLGVGLFLLVASRIKVIPQDQRFAVVVLGKFQKLVGPGVAIKYQGAITQWARLSLGQPGRYLGDGLADFQGVALPVRFDEPPKDGVRINSFASNEVWVEPTEVLTVRCEHCGRYNEVALSDEASTRAS